MKKLKLIFQFAVFTILFIGRPVNAAPIWSTPVALASTKVFNQNGATISGLRVATNAKGQVIAVWNQGNEIKTRKILPAGWQKTVSLSAPGETASVVDLTESSTGDAVVLWSNTNANLNLQSRFFHQGVWNMAAPIPSTSGAQVLSARVRYDGSATPIATLVWVEKSATTCALMSATGTAVTGWGNIKPIQVSSACYNFIDLAINNRGEVALALGTFPPLIRHAGSPAVVTSRNRRGVWTRLTDLGSGAYGTVPKVAIANNGVAIVSFSDANLGVQWSRRSPADGSWSAKSILDGGVPAVPTRIAMASNGDALVVYNAYYTVMPPAPLQASQLKNGSNVWGMPTTISEVTGCIESFDVSATPAGSFVVSWVDATPSLPVGVLGAAMGVSSIPVGATSWSINTLDGDRLGTYIMPTPTTVATVAGKAIVLWGKDYVTPVSNNTYSQLFISETTIQ